MITLNDDDIETYTTSIRQNELMCYKCDDGDKICDQVQKSILQAAIKRFPFNQQSNHIICGNEGMVLKFSTTIVKVLASNEEEHKRRILLWLNASRKDIGPLILSRTMSWFVPFQYWIMEEKSTFTGWSCIQMKKIDKLSKPVEVNKLIALFDKTANAGMLHMDPSVDNIRLNDKKEYTFIDWEQGRIFETVRRKKRCLFCLFAKFIMIRFSIYNLTFTPYKTITEELERASKQNEIEINKNIDLFFEFIHLTKAYSSNFLRPVHFREDNFRAFFQLLGMQTIHPSPKWCDNNDLDDEYGCTQQL